MKKISRQSNWELMRIVAMLMIVAGHFINQSQYMLCVPRGGIYEWFGVYFGSGARIAVNMFLLLGCWFMVDATYRARRITKLYFNVWTLTVPITLVVLLLGYHSAGKDIVRGFVPFLGKALWFASAYLALVLVAPWLNKIFLLPQKSLRNLLLLLTCLINLWVTIYSFDRMEDQWLDCLVSFMWTYLFVGYYKRYCLLTFNKWMVLFWGLGSYVLLTTLAHVTVNMDGGVGHAIGHMANNFLTDYKTIPNLFIAMCFFYFFQNLHIGKVDCINYVAQGAFTTYIIHQTPVFIHVLWFDLYNCTEGFVEYNPIMYSIFVVGSVYFASLFVERFRRRFVEPMLFELRAVKSLEVQLDRFYKNV